MTKWEKKYRNLGTINDLKNKVDKLQGEVAWALVTEKERTLDPLKRTLQQQEARKPKFVEKVDEAKVFVDFFLHDMLGR